jgi:iron-sulfur cluster assembly protein
MAENTASSNNSRAVTITTAAIEELKRLLAQESDSGIFLRIGVAAGGCSGMSYMMAFAKQKTDHDQEFDYDGLRIVVDSKALPFLTGSTLEYKGSMLGGGFQFANPNAKRSCGCGSSFTC